MTVSLVTYRHPLAAVRAVVDAVMKSGNVERFYVIDNAGETGLKAELAAVYPQIEYIPLDNPGFGAAHNVAIRKAMEAGAKYHAVVNPDIDFKPGTLEKIAAFLDQNGDVGLAMPKTMNPDGTMQYNAKLLPTPWDSFGRRFLPKRLTAQRNRRYELRDADHERTFDCGYLCGCFLVFRLECLKDIGLFDERYFMYPEDIDISRRVYSSRWHSVHFAGAEVVHAHEAASYKNWRMTWIHITNMVKYYNKWGWFLDAERQRVNQEVWAAAMAACD